MQERKDKWTVGQWMTPNPEYVSPNTSVRKAFIQMRQGGFRHLLVVENEQLVGIVTDRDLRRPDVSKDAEGWNEFYNIDDDCEVRFVMSTDIKAIGPYESMEKAVRLFLENKIGALPVLDKLGKPIGILTTHDMLNAFDMALKMVGDQLRKKELSTY